MYEASSTETMAQHTRKSKLRVRKYIKRDLYLSSSLLYNCSTTRWWP